MLGRRPFESRFIFLFLSTLLFLTSESAFARFRLFSNRSRNVRTISRPAVREAQPVHSEEQPKARPIQNSMTTPPKEKGPEKVETQTPETPKLKPAFGRTIAQTFQNRPKLFQGQVKEIPLDPFTAIFCENPHKLVCETSMENVAGTTWPQNIFPRDPRGAFATGKKLLNYLTDHHFEYDESNKRAIHDQLSATQIYVTNISGPTAFSTPPRIEVPPTYWNLFSVFHELGHIIDFKSTYPLNKAEVAQVLRNTNNISSIDTMEALIKEKQAEMTADKVAAKGFAILGDPHIRKLGYEPVDSQSLLKTIKSAMGFLCSSEGSPEHPSGKFRINFIGADEDLRSVLGCSLRR